MGWKNIKDAFGIEKHIVCVAEKGICIGSGYVHDLVVIDLQTGQVRENETFKGFLQKSYPSLGQASPEEVLALICSPDTFSASIPVFTYEGGLVIEKRCETLGWPNATHDGELMYENTFHTDKNTVIGWAKRSARLKVSHTAEHLERLKQQLADVEGDLVSARASVHQLETDHPGVPEAD